MSATALRSLPLPPGQRGYPIIGDTGDWARDPLLFAQDRHARYGPVWRTHLLGRPCVVLLGPEANRFVLGSHMHLFSSRAGWMVMYSSVFTHHMPELWCDPERFDPQRFAPPREEGKRPFALIGFGGGPRVCVGLGFAQMQMRIVMSHLLRTLRFELLPEQDFSPVAVPTPMPRDGLRVRVNVA